MFRFALSRELLQYVALIHFRFFSSVGKCEQIGVMGKIECDRPISIGSDWLGCVLCSEFELDFPNQLSVLIIGGSGVEARDDIVEVNGLPLNEVKPLGIRESRASRCINDA